MLSSQEFLGIVALRDIADTIDLNQRLEPRQPQCVSVRDIMFLMLLSEMISNT